MGLLTSTSTLLDLSDILIAFKLAYICMFMDIIGQWVIP